jgi:predicted ribosome quality control (RQC) complex YloA/Tae2 family protein
MSGLLGRPGHIQKIYSTSRYLCLQVRVERKNICLYIGRGGGFEGLWLGESIPVSFLRKRDRWLEWCRSHLSSALLLGISMDSIDRGISLQIQNAKGRQSFFVSWIGRDCFFAFYEANSEKFFSCWNGEFSAPGDFTVFDPLGRKNMTENEAALPLQSISVLLAEEEKAAKKAALPKKKFKSLESKISKIEKDLQKIRQWKDLQDWLVAVDVEALSSGERLVIGELNYKWPKGLNAWQRRDWAFGQVKRLRDAEQLQTHRKETFVQELSALHSSGQQTLENLLRPIGPVWKSVQTPAAVVKQPDSDYVIHSIPEGKIAVGLSARGNDQMRKTWAKSDDWWIHSSVGASAHAIIKLSQTGIPTPETITMAARFIAKQSRITATQIELIITQVKNVRGVTGSPGMVTYKKQKMLLCDLSGSE